jgi:phosphatidylinositol alpha-1,6-mannosyltransferase
MKALLITNDFPPMPGGEATLYARICATVPPQTVIVLAPHVAGDHAFDARQPYRIIRRRAPVHPHPIARIYQLVILGLCAARLVRRERVSAVHVAHLYLGPIALALRRLLGIPYVLYLHGGEIAPYMRWRPIRRFAEAVVRGAGRVVVNSEFTRRHYAALGMAHPSTDVLAPGADVVRFRPDAGPEAARARYRADGTRTILTVGRLIERKGHDMVIAALPQIRQAAGAVRYVIAGAGPEEPRLRALARRVGCADDVVFAGHVPDDDLPAVFAACDVFVMPSRALAQRDGIEGFGIVFVEAGACGKPVVGGKSGGMADAVADGVTGILVDPENVDEIAGAVSGLLRDRATAGRMGAEGRRRAEALEVAWRRTVRAVWDAAPGVAAAGDSPGRQAASHPVEQAK